MNVCKLKDSKLLIENEQSIVTELLRSKVTEIFVILDGANFKLE